MSKKQKNGSNREMVEQQNQKLKAYAEQLSQLHTDIESNGDLSIKHGKVALELALKAGTILREVKTLVPRGDWEKWLMKNVDGITLRTAQNYMRLATEVAIEQERVRNKKQFGNADTKHVSFLAQCEGLREAYIVAGIIKKPQMIDAAVMPGEKDMTPARMKAENKTVYSRTLSEARLRMVERVRNELRSYKRVTWNLSGWTIQNDKVLPTGENNEAGAFFESLIDWMTIRNFSSLTAEDEIHQKAGVILREMLRAIVLANRPPRPEVAESVSDYAFEMNTPVEAAEKMPA